MVTKKLSHHIEFLKPCWDHLNCTATLFWNSAEVGLYKLEQVLNQQKHCAASGTTWLNQRWWTETDYLKSADLKKKNNQKTDDILHAGWNYAGI